MNHIESSYSHDFGISILVEDCEAVKINDLLACVERKTREALLNAELEALGLPLTLTQSKTHFGGSRHWFVCPSCNKRIGILYRHVSADGLLCRRSLGVDYRKHRQ